MILVPLLLALATAAPRPQEGCRDGGERSDSLREALPEALAAARRRLEEELDLDVPSDPEAIEVELAARFPGCPFRLLSRRERDALALLARRYPPSGPATAIGVLEDRFAPVGRYLPPPGAVESRIRLVVQRREDALRSQVRRDFREGARRDAWLAVVDDWIRPSSDEGEGLVGMRELGESAVRFLPGTGFAILGGAVLRGGDGGVAARFRQVPSFVVEVGIRVEPFWFDAQVSPELGDLRREQRVGDHVWRPSDDLRADNVGLRTGWMFPVGPGVEAGPLGGIGLVDADDTAAAEREGLSSRDLSWRVHAHWVEVGAAVQWRPFSEGGAASPLVARLVGGHRLPLFAGNRDLADRRWFVELQAGVSGGLPRFSGGER